MSNIVVDLVSDEDEVDEMTSTPEGFRNTGAASSSSDVVGATAEIFSAIWEEGQQADVVSGTVELNELD